MEECLVKEWVTYRKSKHQRVSKAKNPIECCAYLQDFAKFKTLVAASCPAYAFWIEFLTISTFYFEAQQAIHRNDLATEIVCLQQLLPVVNFVRKYNIKKEIISFITDMLVIFPDRFIYYLFFNRTISWKGVPHRNMSSDRAIEIINGLAKKYLSPLVTKELIWAYSTALLFLLRLTRFWALLLGAQRGARHVRRSSENDQKRAKSYFKEDDEFVKSKAKEVHIAPKKLADGVKAARQLLLLEPRERETPYQEKSAIGSRLHVLKRKR